MFSKLAVTIASSPEEFLISVPARNSKLLYSGSIGCNPRARQPVDSPSLSKTLNMVSRRSTIPITFVNSEISSFSGNRISSSRLEVLGLTSIRVSLEPVCKALFIYSCAPSRTDRSTVAWTIPIIRAPTLSNK